LFFSFFFPQHLFFINTSSGLILCFLSPSFHPVHHLALWPLSVTVLRLFSLCYILFLLYAHFFPRVCATASPVVEPISLSIARVGPDFSLRSWTSPVSLLIASLFSTLGRAVPCVSALPVDLLAAFELSFRMGIFSIVLYEFGSPDHVPIFFHRRCWQHFGCCLPQEKVSLSEPYKFRTCFSPSALKLFFAPEDGFFIFYWPTRRGSRFSFAEGASTSYPFPIDQRKPGLVRSCASMPLDPVRWKKAVFRIVFFVFSRLEGAFLWGFPPTRLPAKLVWNITSGLRVPFEKPV